MSGSVSAENSGSAPAAAAPADGAQPLPATGRRVGSGFILIYALAYVGTWLVVQTPILVTIALRVRELSPQNAASDLSLVLGMGAFFAVVGGPLFGSLSDRTTSRFGMRRPWLIGGMLIGAGCVLLISQAPTIWVVLLGWCLGQLAYNAVLAAIVAVLPDQVEPTQRGTVAGVLGICLALGQVAGTFLVQFVPPSMLLRFMVPAVIGMAAVLALALILPDRRLGRAEVRPFSWSEFLGSFWISPARHPDFAWAWLSRFLFVMGAAFLSTYQPLYLIDKLGYEVAQVPELVFKSMLMQASMIVVASLVSGKLSDALGRRKIFVCGSAVVYAMALWIIAVAPTYSVFLLGMAITGIGQGVYHAVDLALFTQILPNRERDAAKDLGIANIANALPQTVAPALAPAILFLGSGSYTWLFVAAGIIVLSGSIAILPVRSVR